MLTFKEFINEARDVEQTKAHLNKLASHPNTPEHERSAAHAALGRLGKSEHTPEHKPEHKEPAIAVGTHATTGWNKPSHMMVKPNGERRYISHHPGKKIYKTHNRSESEYHHHESLQKAQEHLHKQGYTQTHTSHEAKRDSYVHNTMSKSKGSKQKFTSGEPSKLQDWKNKLDVGRKAEKPRFPQSDRDKTTVNHKKDGKTTHKTTQG